MLKDELEKQHAIVTNFDAEKVEPAVQVPSISPLLNPNATEFTPRYSPSTPDPTEMLLCNLLVPFEQVHNFRDADDNLLRRARRCLEHPVAAQAHESQEIEFEYWMFHDNDTSNSMILPLSPGSMNFPRKSKKVHFYEILENEKDWDDSNGYDLDLNGERMEAEWGLISDWAEQHSDSE